MASGINIPNCWYQVLEFLISRIRILDINNLHCWYQDINSKTNLPKYTTLYLKPPCTLLETFDEHLTFCDQITAFSKACYLDSSTACTIATSVVHSKLDYVILSNINSLSLNYPSPADRSIKKSLARTVMKAPKSCHITGIPIVSSTHWLRITEQWTHRIQAPFTSLRSSHNYPTSVTSPPHQTISIHSTSSQYSFFIRRHSCLAIFIISTYRKSTTRFPTSHRWTVYVTPKSPKG